MATISIYQEEDNKTYQVSVDINSSILDLVNGSPSNGDTDYYLKITTTLKKSDGSSFPTYVIRNMSDVPDGYSTASTFTELVDDYVQYFIDQAQLGQSSSSSSEMYSESSSSSSSSFLYSLSSSSSSSSP